MLQEGSAIDPEQRFRTSHAFRLPCCQNQACDTFHFPFLSFPHGSQLAIVKVSKLTTPKQIPQATGEKMPNPFPAVKTSINRVTETEVAVVTRAAWAFGSFQ